MTNDKAQMTKECQIPNDKKRMSNVKRLDMKNNNFDLEDRTLKFSKNCIDLCKMLAKNAISVELIGQLVRSSSSVGANYREANDSITRKDFFHKIGICRREAKESRYWLELLVYTDSASIEKAEFLIDEASQLTRIFASINSKQ